MEYDKLESLYDRTGKQRNIMVLVGNGFDINVLQHYRKNGFQHDNITTSFTKFFEFLEYMGWYKNKNNSLVEKMRDEKINTNNQNWADFEARIPEVLDDTDIDRLKVNKDLKDLQRNFSLFLNKVVTPEIQNELSTDSTKKWWAFRSLSSFLGDLNEENYKKLIFPTTIDKYQKFDYLFINFNYTQLLDNYIYLDKQQFDPHMYKTVDTNFGFYPNPNDYSIDTHLYKRYSTYVHTKIDHPHGQQNIPRSLLFGTNNPKYNNDAELRKFNKDYWVQYSKFYGNLFPKTDLFITYGSSLGDSDKWWWRKICNSIIASSDKNPKEWIIYWYNPSENNSLNLEKDIFCYGKNDSNPFSKEEREILNDRIAIVDYKDPNQLNFLSLNKETFSDDKSWKHKNSDLY